MITKLKTIALLGGLMIAPLPIKDVMPLANQLR
jgi:hypothetical protein